MIEEDLESKSQSIGDWWNCVPSLDKKGVSGTLLVRLSDAVEGVKDVREEAQAKRLPINWRSNKEVIELVRKEIKNAEEETSNVFLPEQGKNKHEIEILKIKLKLLKEEKNKEMLDLGELTKKVIREVEVRVRDETLNEVFKEQDERLYKLSNELKLISKVKRNSLEDCVHQYQKICKSFYKYLKITEETKKRFLVKSEEELLLKKEDKKVLCIGCGKPIHINEFGGLNNKGCFHNNVSCLIKIKKSESKEEIEVQKE